MGGEHVLVCLDGKTEGVGHFHRRTYTRTGKIAIAGDTYSRGHDELLMRGRYWWAVKVSRNYNKADCHVGNGTLGFFQRRFRMALRDRGPVHFLIWMPGLINMHMESYGDLHE